MSWVKFLFFLFFGCVISVTILLIFKLNPLNLLIDIWNDEFYKWPILDWNNFWAKKEQSDGARNFMLTLAGIAGALAGVYNLFNATRRTRTTIAQQKICAKQETNERFFEAMRLLASKKSISRAGGVQLLEQIAIEEPRLLDGAIVNLQAVIKDGAANRAPDAAPDVDLVEAIRALIELDTLRKA